MINKLTKFALTLSIMLCYSSLAYSASYSKVASIEALTFSNKGVRVKLTEMSPAEGCANQNWYYLPTPDSSYGQMVSSLIAAKATGEKISLQLLLCEPLGTYSYPKINHIYMCDSEFCS